MPVTAAVTDPAPQPPTPAPEGDRAAWDAAKWMQHAKSMEGRFRQSQETVTSLQGTMTEMGEELVRAQTALQRPPAPRRRCPQPRQPPLITPQDVETYGEDFLNVAQRAALQAVQPRLQQLEQRNQQLERQLRRTNIQTIEQVLDAQVPNWPHDQSEPEI